MQIAFIFPGQGSQTIGMLSTLTTKYSEIKETFYEASSVLGYDLWKLTQQGPIAKLNKTWHAQPALLTAAVALWRIWQKENGNIPALMAGHSLGEYSALVCAGVISFTDAVHLVEMRGKLMQKAVPEGTGAMSAIIGLDHITIAEICKKTANGQIVSPVNYNSPNQIVISGHREAVERANIACKVAGAKHVLLLPISIPSHCALMRPVAAKLAIELKKISFNIPVVPVINNVNARCETTPEIIRHMLIRQLYSPVQWIKTIEYIVSQNIKYLYELGPGNILTNLTKHITDSLVISAINELDKLSAALLRCREDYHEF